MDSRLELIRLLGGQLMFAKEQLNYHEGSTRGSSIYQQRGIDRWSTQMILLKGQIKDIIFYGRI